MNQIIFIFFVFVLILTICYQLFFKFQNSFEGYSNYHLDTSMSNFPEVQNKLLIQDIYPKIDKNQLSNNTSNDIWWHYPIFKLGSYDQITNNIKYPNNPDEGTCMPSSMCNTLYYNKNLGSNYIKQLPPINSINKTRIGYFDTENQLIDNLPFSTNEQNILF